MRWNRNAVRAKARKRLIEPESSEAFIGDAAKIKPSKPTWKINIERFDGQRIQITAHAIHGKLLTEYALETGNQLGRRIGNLLHCGTLD